LRRAADPRDGCEGGDEVIAGTIRSPRPRQWGPPYSRYDVAVALCEILGRDDVTVEPVSSAFFPLPAPRARSEAMVNHRLEQLGINPMRPWREALEAYLIQELGRR